MTMTLDSERETFEKWVQTTSGWKVCRARNKPMHLRQNADGSYNDFRVNDRWFAWQARAHLAQPAQLVDIEAIREVIEVRDWLLARAQDGQMQRSVYTSNYQLREMAGAIRAHLLSQEAEIERLQSGLAAADALLRDIKDWDVNQAQGAYLMVPLNLRKRIQAHLSENADVQP